MNDNLIKYYDKKERLNHRLKMLKESRDELQKEINKMEKWIQDNEKRLRYLTTSLNESRRNK